MRTVKENIKKNHKLQNLLDKSKQRRYRKQKKTEEYCRKSIERREAELNKEYPLKQMRRERNLFPVLLFLMKCRLALCGVRICLLNSFDRSKIDGPVIFVPTHIGKFDIEEASAIAAVIATIFGSFSASLHIAWEIISV